MRGIVRLISGRANPEVLDKLVTRSDISQTSGDRSHCFKTHKCSDHVLSRHAIRPLESHSRQIRPRHLKNFRVQKKNRGKKKILQSADKPCQNILIWPSRAVRRQHLFTPGVLKFANCVKENRHARHTWGEALRKLCCFQTLWVEMLFRVEMYHL